MGSTRHERDYRRGRAAYVGAAHALIRAMAEYEAARVPLLAGPDGELPAWTPHQIRVTVAAAGAWQQLVVRRKEYESLMREYRGDLTPPADSRRPPPSARARPTP